MWQSILIFIPSLIVIYLLRCHFRGSYCKIEKNIVDKIILITGGSKGIGQETINQLAKYQCKVIFGCRSKPVEFLNQLMKQYPKFQVEFIPLDLQDWASIKEFIRQVQTKVQKIDILINNAAIMGTLTRKLTKYGIEEHFGTNYVGPFYLTQQLVPLLKKSDSPRLINVSSIAHTFEDLNLNDINCDRWANSILWSRYYTYRAYGNTKFALILNAQEFSKRTGIPACSIHPGVVRSSILQYQLSTSWSNLLLSFFWPIFAFFTKDCYQGCQTTLHCIMLQDNQLIDGGFYSDCQLRKPKYTSSEKAQKLWNFTNDLIEKIEQRENRK